jgi:tRNA(Ile)-lysidine synthetase-like protein
MYDFGVTKMFSSLTICDCTTDARCSLSTQYLQHQPRQHQHAALKDMSTIVQRAFDTCMSRMPHVRRLGLCVSGGPDSMSLLWAAHRWAKREETHVFVVHVDHAIRTSSAVEAQWLHDVVQQQAGLTCVLKRLQWEEGEKVSHETLRAKRYQCFESVALERDVTHLATAHHWNDMVETFVQRVHMASGWAGLAHPIRELSRVRLDSGPWFVRPLLDVPKNLLVSSLPSNSDYIRDPHNQNPKYLRTRVRDVLEADEVLQQQIGDVCKWMNGEWGVVETRIAELEIAFVQHTASRASVVQVGLVEMLLQRSSNTATTIDNNENHNNNNKINRKPNAVDELAVRAIIRRCLARAKGTTRMRDATMDHCVKWMCQQVHVIGLSLWSEGGVLMRWRMREGKFTCEPVSERTD